MLRIGTSLLVRLRVGAALSISTILSLLASTASAQTPVFFGDVIDEPGVYFLAGNQSGSGDGIRIQSDDVVLLLTRFTLRGDGGFTGIAAVGYDNVQIYGGRVTDFKLGIALSDGEDCTVQGTRIDHCQVGGISMRTMRESWVVRMRADHHVGIGVDSLNGEDNRFISVQSHDNGGDGIRIATLTDVAAVGEGPVGNKVKLCWAAYNGLDGIRLGDSDDNDVQRNQCVFNDDAGIRLDTNFGAPPPEREEALPNAPGSQGNYLRSNWCVFNDEGIVAEELSTDNTATNNTALANHDHDMVDENDAPPCANTWLLNFFLVRDGDGAVCIF